MEVEVALYLPSIRLNTSIRKYVIRTQRLAYNHLIRLVLETASPKTQLGRIQAFIRGLVDLESLELIENFKYSP